MKKILKLVLISIMCLSLVGCGDKGRSSEEIGKVLEKNGIETNAYKYEFGMEATVSIFFKDDFTFFRLGKESLEEKYYEKALEDNGGITVTIVSPTDVSAYSMSKDEVALDTVVEQEAKDKIDKILEKYNITQEELFNYIVDFGKENLLKETKDDKKSTIDLAMENGYTYYVDEDTLNITNGNYTLFVTVNNGSVKSGALMDTTDTSVMFTIPKTSTLGTNIFLVSASSTFYDLDKSKVIAGTGTVTTSDIAKGEALMTKCYDMLRDLHITTILELRQFYDAVK